MRERRLLMVLWGAATIAAIGLFLKVQPSTHTSVLRVAIVDSRPGDRLRKEIPDLQKELKSKGRRVDIHVFSIPYDDLFDSLLAQKSDTASESSAQQRFDVVLVDDPWIAKLASDHTLAPLPHKWLERGSPLESTILDYAPEFLRVDYYRDRDANDADPRRPKLSELEDPQQPAPDRALKPLHEGYELYALPYLGNMQALTVSADVASAAPKGGQPAAITWQSLIDQTHSGRVQFYSRLGSNNGALIDFLPILWSYGGCLVGKEKETGKEVTGFQGDSGIAAERALQVAVDLSRKSSPEYSRFDDDVLFQYITSESSLVSISWLAFRGLPLADAKVRQPAWYQMPESTENPAGVCVDNDERVSTGVGKDPKSQRSGGLGLWSLAIEAGASDMDLAKEFVQDAVLKLNEKGPTDEECTTPNMKSPLLEPLSVSEGNQWYPSPLRSKMSCGVRDLVARARPRLSHPKWREIEDAIGLQVREAHSQAISAHEATCRAAKDVQRILNGGDFTCSATPAAAPSASGPLQVKKRSPPRPPA